MTVEYQFAAIDLIASAQYQQSLLPQTWSKIYYSGIVPVLGVGLALATGSIIIATIFTVLFCLSGWLIGQASRRSSYAALVSEKNFSAPMRKLKVTLKQDAVEFSSQIGTLSCPWESVIKVVRSKQHIHFVFSPAYIKRIPARAFSGEAALEEFMKTAQGYLKDKKDKMAA